MQMFSVNYALLYGDNYFVTGLSYADVFGELCTAIYLSVIQYIVDPLSQNYFSFNLTVIKSSFQTLFDVINLYSFIFYFLINFYAVICLFLCGKL